MCLWIQIASHNRIQVQGNLAHGTSHLRVIWCAHGIGACEGQQVSSAPHYALLYARAATKPKVLWAHVWGLCVLTVLLMHVCASVLTCVRRRLCLIECASCERVLTCANGGLFVLDCFLFVCACVRMSTCVRGWEVTCTHTCIWKKGEECVSSLPFQGIPWAGKQQRTNIWPFYLPLNLHKEEW